MESRQQPPTDTRDRLIALEIKLSHVVDMLETMKSLNEAMNAKVARVEQKFSELQGAKWLLVTLAVTFTGLVAAAWQLMQMWQHK